MIPITTELKLVFVYQIRFFENFNNEMIKKKIQTAGIKFKKSMLLCDILEKSKKIRNA